MTRQEAIKYFDRLGVQDANGALKLLLAYRSKVDAAEYDFLFAVRAFELSELWRVLSPGTFEQALSRLNLCSPARYTRWKRADEELGESLVREIGVSGATQAVRLESGSDRALAVKAMRATASTQGTVVSERTARSIVGKLLPRFAVLDARDTIGALRKENAALRLKIEELEKAKADLERRLVDCARSRERSRGEERAASKKPDKSKGTRARTKDRSQTVG